MKRSLIAALLGLTFGLIPAGAQPFGSTLASTLLANKNRPFTAQEIGTIKFADVTGDGYPDLCFMDTVGIWCAPYVPNTKMFGAQQLFSSEFNLTNTATDSIWQTWQFGDIDNDGFADFCIRQTGGVVCRRSDGAQFVDIVRGGGHANAFSDDQGFGSDASYWRTIRLADVDGDHILDICGRSPLGVVCQKILPGTLEHSFIYDTWTVWHKQFSDANGWKSSEAYWGTIQFPDINKDGKADVCGRASAGMDCAVSDGTQFGTVFGETSFSDANYWNQKQYYSTIQFADIDGDGYPELCGRGVAGMYCGKLTYRRIGGPTFIETLAETSFSDANGWNVENKYATIRIVDVNGDGKADVCGRYSDGYRCALSQTTWTPSFAASQLWVQNFGDIYGWNLDASHWRTVQPVQTTPNLRHAVAICGRGDAGIWCSDYH